MQLNLGTGISHHPWILLSFVDLCLKPLKGGIWQVLISIILPATDPSRKSFFFPLVSVEVPEGRKGGGKEKCPSNREGEKMSQAAPQSQSINLL